MHVNDAVTVLEYDDSEGLTIVASPPKMTEQEVAVGADGIPYYLARTKAAVTSRPLLWGGLALAAAVVLSRR